MVKATKSVSLLLVISLVLAFFGTVLPSNTVKADTITVNNGGGADYTTIQDAIDNANPGDTINVSGGPYSENVNVYKTVNLIGIGGPITVTAAVTTDHVFDVTTNNVGIKGFWVSGASASNKAGIYLSGSTTGCTIENNTSNCNYHGIGGGGTNNTIRDNTVSDNDDRGIVLWGAVNCTISGNDVSVHTSGTAIGIALYSNSTGNTLTGNEVYTNGSGIVLAATSPGNTIQDNDVYSNTGHGILLSESSNNNTVSGNTVHNNGNTGIAIDNTNNHIINSNNVYENSYVGLDFFGSINNTITGNTANINHTGIYLHGGCSNNTVSGNTANENSYHGICVRDASSNTIANNTTKNNHEAGIKLNDADYNTITGNETGNNPSTKQDYGIWLQDNSTNNTITGNIITANEYQGIHAHADSDNNIFSNNQIYDNGEIGIRVDQSSNCTIDGNTIHDNILHMGISLWDCSNFLIKNNEVYNEYIGMNLGGSDDCTILNNSIHDNDIGIQIGYGPTHSNDNDIIGNYIYHNRPGSPGISGGIVLAGDAWGTVVNYNVIVDNCSDPELYGLNNGNTSETVNAENNWWGANNGPEPLGNGDKVSNYVDYDPWLVLTIGASPTSISIGATSAITAGLTMNSDGEDTSALGHVYDGTEIIFTTDKGSIGSMQTTKETEGGKAVASLKSGVAGTATVCAEAPYGHEVPMDQYKVCTSVKLIPLQQPKKPFEDSSSSFPAQNTATRPNLSTKYVNAQPQLARANQPVTVYASIANGGDEAGDYEVTLKVNGQVEEVKKGIVGGHAAVPLKFEVLRAEAGIYTVDVNGQKSYFTIAGEEAKPVSFAGNTKLLALVLWVVLVIAVITALAIVLIRRRQSYY